MWREAFRVASVECSEVKELHADVPNEFGVVNQVSFPQSLRLLNQAMQNKSGGLPAGAGFNGSNARVKGGVLYFTTADGKTASYKVVRPKSTANNPQAASGITGTWISVESSGDGIIFTVQEGGAVSGKEFPAAVIQMLR